MGILSELKPEPVFRYFEEICGIPHGSGNTKAISDYCVAFARRNGLRVVQDDKNNVIIWKEGTKGYEQSAPVMIQGHLDMVCEKEQGCGIDFERDGLSLKLEDDVISASGTTLGGDDGIAVAYALAILESEDIPHPPLEVVFTVDEEIGMLGAAALDYSLLKSRIMLNLDSEEEGYLLVSCAGGIGVTVCLPLQREEAEGIPVTLTVTGLRGGHSGVEIDRGRANANQLLGRTLYQLSQEFSFHIVDIQGGLKDNAIPRESKVNLILINSDTQNDGSTDVDKLKEKISACEDCYRKEYQVTDPMIKLDLIEGDAGSGRAMDRESTDRVIAALVNLPGGIQRMSFDVEGLVQTSLNLGILKTEETEAVFSFAVRSSVESEKREVVDRIRCLSDVLGGTATCQGEYPAWEYRKESPLRDLMAGIFEEQYGRKPVIQALHAGVECGLFAGALPGLDCVSYGPDMKGIHTPEESMDVKSVQRTWEYTLEILKRLR